jgi:hypothetical protein
MFTWITAALIPSASRAGTPRNAEDLRIADDESRARARRHYIASERARSTNAPELDVFTRPIRLY